MNKYVFKSGAKVEGTLEQILKTAKALGETVDLSKLEGPVPTGYYVSKTHGLIKVNEMAPAHIRNAIVARSKEVLETIRKRKITDKEFLNEYIRLSDDKTIVSLFEELNKKAK